MKRDDLNQASEAPETGVEEASQGQTESESPQTEPSNVVSMTGHNSDTLATFNAALDNYKTHIEGGKLSARLCADLGIDHFALCGDLIYLQRLFDLMRGAGKNFTRPAALIKWIVDHAPVKLEGDTLKKDKLREQKMWPDSVARQTCLDAAHAVAFWDHKPDTELMRFGAMDVLKAVQQTISKFNNEEKYAPASEQASNLVAEIGAFIDSKVEAKAARTA